MFTWGCVLVASLRDLQEVKKQNCPVVIPSGDSDNNTLRLALVECSAERARHTSPSSHFSKSPEQTQNVYENKGSGWKSTTLTPSLSEEENLVLPALKLATSRGWRRHCFLCRRYRAHTYKAMYAPPHPFSSFLGARQPTGMSDCSDEEGAGVVGPIRTQCHFERTGYDQPLMAATTPPAVSARCGEKRRDLGRNP